MRTRTVVRHPQMPGLLAGLKLALTIGAAREDASPDQAARLDATVLPLMFAPQWLIEGDDSALYAALADLMGPDWKPRGNWAQQLAVLS